MVALCRKKKTVKLKNVTKDLPLSVVKEISK